MLEFLGFVLVLGLIGTVLFLAWPLRHPLPTESDYTYRSNPWWQYYYAHKYLRPMPRPERDSGLTEHFSGQDFELGAGVAELSDVREICIAATGDLMFRRDLAGVGGERIWDEIGEFVLTADLSIGNLEFAINEDWIIEETLRFSVPPSFADPLVADERFGRFDVLSFANNHINDSLKGGILSSLEYAEARGIVAIGASRSPEEQEDVQIIERDGLRIALLGYTFSTNDVPLEVDFQFGTNIVRFNALDDEDYDPSLIHRHIARARELGADLIIACNHWGLDLEFYPPKRLVRRAHALMEAGIDVILGHHPHVAGPSERYRTKDGRDTLIFYSLGNLTSRGLIFPVQRYSLVTRITVSHGLDAQGQRRALLSGVEIMPVYHAKRRGPLGLENRLLRVSEARRQIAAGKGAAAGMDLVERYCLPRLDAGYMQRFGARGVVYR